MDASVKWMIFQFTPHQTTTLPKTPFFESFLLLHGQCAAFKYVPKTAATIFAFSSVYILLLCSHQQVKIFFLFILGLAVYCPKNINHGWSRCNCMVRVVFLVSVQELQLYLIITCNEKYQTFTIRYPLQLCFRIRLFFQPSEFDFLKGQCHEIFTCLIPLPNPLTDMLKHFQYDFYFAE